MLWVDRYRPRTLNRVTVHAEEAQRLRNLVGLLTIIFFAIFYFMVLGLVSLDFTNHCVQVFEKGKCSP